MTSGRRLRARLLGTATTLATLVLLGLLAYLSTLYHGRADWSASGRNTLSPASAQLLGAMAGAIEITVYSRADSISGRVIGELLSRYSLHKPDLTVRFVNPDLEPERLRALGINRDGVIDLAYQGRSQRVEQVSEAAISNALQQVARRGERWVGYLTGHGERSLEGRANHDLGNFGARLAERGYRLQPVDLLAAGEVPGNTAVLVLASPRVALLREEAALIEAHVRGGGNLLWLLDPGDEQGLDGLAALLGLERPAGTLIDPATQRFSSAGAGDATFVIVNRYARHPVTQGLDLLTVFPGAGALRVDAPADWTASVLMRSGDRVWAELGPLQGSIGFDAEREQRGPFDLGFAVSRPAPGGDGEQRIAIIGDGDFLSNAALGNGGNLDLGLRLFNWLSADDVLLDIPARSDPDLSLRLSRGATALIGLGWFIGLPLLLGGAGLGIWLRRRHR